MTEWCFHTQIPSDIPDGIVPRCGRRVVVVHQRQHKCQEAGWKNIHIWDDNGCCEFLDMARLEHSEEGDLGPVYGFQWKHFVAKYVDMRTDHTAEGLFIDLQSSCLEICLNWDPGTSVHKSVVLWIVFELHVFVLEVVGGMGTCGRL